MRGRTKLLSLAATFSILLVVSMVFASGVIDVADLSLFSLGSESRFEPDSPGATLVLKPQDSLYVNTGYHAANPIWATTKDYVLEAGFQIGDKFNVTVELTNVVDLFTWQINMTWNPAILSRSNIYKTDFLGATKDTSSEELGMVINATDNTNGFCASAETVLGDVGGVTNAGTGTLVKVEFEILAYGGTDITFSPSTKLLDSLGADIVPDSMTNGYFRNTIKGDTAITLPTSTVDIDDILDVKNHRTPAGPGGYDKIADTVFSGAIDIDDILQVKSNRGRTVTP